MEYKINFEITDDFVKKIIGSNVKEVTLDLCEKEYLTSREVTELIILSKSLDHLFFKNANEHVQQTVQLLKLSSYLKMK